jgi:hypothetical protein
MIFEDWICHNLNLSMKEMQRNEKHATMKLMEHIFVILPIFFADFSTHAT